MSWHLTRINQTGFSTLMLDIRAINEGIYTQNFDLIETGAANRNGHAPLSNESRSLVMETLGDRMPVIGEFDNLVHSRADSIRMAAINRDMGKVLEQYRIVGQGCLNFHAAFQDETVQQDYRNDITSKDYKCSDIFILLSYYAAYRIEIPILPFHSGTLFLRMIYGYLPPAFCFFLNL